MHASMALGLILSPMETKVIQKLKFTLQFDSERRSAVQSK
jgi:hypothetical protein